jgi:hypothetical protein
MVADAARTRRPASAATWTGKPASHTATDQPGGSGMSIRVVSGKLTRRGLLLAPVFAMMPAPALARRRRGWRWPRLHSRGRIFYDHWPVGSRRRSRGCNPFELPASSQGPGRSTPWEISKAATLEKTVIDRLLSVAAIFALGWFASRIGRPDPLRRLHTTGPSRWGRYCPHPSQTRTCSFPASGSSW